MARRNLGQARHRIPKRSHRGALYLHAIQQRSQRSTSSEASSPRPQEGRNWERKFVPSGRATTRSSHRNTASAIQQLRYLDNGFAGPACSRSLAGLEWARGHEAAPARQLHQSHQSVHSVRFWKARFAPGLARQGIPAGGDGQRHPTSEGGVGI